MMTLLLAAILPLAEMTTIKEVAKEYNLNKEQTALLIAIRKTENGRLGSGIEYGIGQEIAGHPAKRYKGNPYKSLRLQAQWAAGTIKRRYNGDVAAFGKRWCPKNPVVWAKNTKHFISQAIKEI